MPRCRRRHIDIFADAADDARASATAIFLDISLRYAFAPLCASLIRHATCLLMLRFRHAFDVFFLAF